MAITFANGSESERGRTEVVVAQPPLLEILNNLTRGLRELKEETRAIRDNLVPYTPK